MAKRKDSDKSFMDLMRSQNRGEMFNLNAHGDRRKSGGERLQSSAETGRRDEEVADDAMEPRNSL